MNINDINKIDLKSQNINLSDKNLFRNEEQNETKQSLNQPSVIILYLILNYYRNQIFQI